MTKIVSNNEYSKMVQKASPNSPIITNCIKAFFVGGLICDLGQFFINTFKSLGCTIEQSNSYTSIILIFIASLLTGLGYIPIPPRIQPKTTKRTSILADVSLVLSIKT